MSKAEVAAPRKRAAKKTPGKKAPATKAPAPAKASNPKLTKTQVIRRMAEQLDVAPKLVTVFFDLLMETATTETRKAGEFTSPGLGKLVNAQRAARMGRNPATGESIKIAAKTTVKSVFPKPPTMPSFHPRSS